MLIVLRRARQWARPRWRSRLVSRRTCAVLLLPVQWALCAAEGVAVEVQAAGAVALLVVAEQLAAPGAQRLLRVLRLRAVPLALLAVAVA